MAEKEHVQVSCNLKGSMVTKFEAIKTYLGIESNGEVLRFIINHYHQKEISKV